MNLLSERLMQERLDDAILTVARLVNEIEFEAWEGRAQRDADSAHETVVHIPIDAWREVEQALKVWRELSEALLAESSVEREVTA